MNLRAEFAQRLGRLGISPCAPSPDGHIRPDSRQTARKGQPYPRIRPGHQRLFARQIEWILTQHHPLRLFPTLPTKKCRQNYLWAGA
jgi:hypothetical protein